MLDRLDWTGRLTLHRRPRRGHRRRRLRAHPAARRRPGGPPRRRDPAADVRRRRPGDHRRRRLRQGAADRARRPGARRADREARRAPGAWIVDFTNPVGIVTQALLDAGHRAIGLCNVAINIQRGIAERFGVAPDRVELEHVGLNHLSWERARPRRRRGPPARAPRRRRRRARRDWSACPSELVRAVRRDPVLLPPLLLPDRARSSRSSATGTPGRRTSWTSRRELLDLYQDQALAEKPALLVDPRRRLLQRGGRAAHRLAPRRGRRRPGRRRAERRRAPRPARRGRRRDPGQDRPRRRASPPPGAARPGDARPGPGGQGLRGARDRGRDDRRPPDGAAGAAREPAGRPTTTSPSRCSTRCSRPTARTCRGSSRAASRGSVEVEQAPAGRELEDQPAALADLEHQLVAGDAPAANPCGPLPDRTRSLGRSGRSASASPARRRPAPSS